MTSFVLFCLVFGYFPEIAICTDESNNRTNNCFMANNNWYFPGNKTFKYHITKSREQYASCEEKCGRIGQNVSFATFENTLLHFGGLKSIIMWVEGNQCSYVLHGDVVKSKNCMYKFRCLCRQKTDNVTSRFHTVADIGSQINHACSRGGQQNRNFTLGRLSVFVTENKAGYDNCSFLCRSTGSEVGIVNDTILSYKQYFNIRNVKLWVNSSNSSSDKTVCHISYQAYLLEYHNCYKRFRCLCQHWNTTEDKVGGTVSNRETSWFVRKDRHIFVYHVNLTFEKAFEQCKRLGAAIVTFTDPNDYISLSKNLTLKGAYWIGDCSNTERTKCLTLTVRNITSLTSSRREMELYSICSRITNVSKLLYHPAFVQMIENMTIDSHKTTKMTRKLNCARDERSSAKAVGAVIGAGVIAIVIGILILSDVQRVYLNIQKCVMAYHVT